MKYKTFFTIQAYSEKLSIYPICAILKEKHIRVCNNYERCEKRNKVKITLEFFYRKNCIINRFCCIRKFTTTYPFFTCKHFCKEVCTNTHSNQLDIFRGNVAALPNIFFCGYESEIINIGTEKADKLLKQLK